MAKNHTWNGNTLAQTLCDHTFTLDLGALPQNIVDQMVKFAAPTLLRNATAGLANEDPAKAVERVGQRIAAWLAGSWSAKGEASAEPRTSILARALAEVLGCEAKDAAARIEAAVEAAINAASLDAESEEEDDKSAVRKLAKQVRDQLRDTQEVSPIYKRLSDEAKAAAQAKKPVVSLADLLK